MMGIKMDINFHDYLTLNKETGELFWKERTPDMFEDGNHTADHTCKRWNSQYAFKRALTGVTTQGYMLGRINGRNLYAHHVVFYMIHGFLPDCVDHINRDKLDNRPGNLRAATRSGNSSNKKSYNGSTSKYLGVCWKKSNRKWVATIQKGSNKGSKIHLGLFDCEKKAAIAYNEAAKSIHGEFANLNKF